MIQVYEKRGMWKVSGSSKKYFTKEEALAAAAENFEVVEEEDAVWHHNIEIETPEEEKDPLEALREARSKRDGDIEEGSHNDGDHEEQELSESTDRWIFVSSRHTGDS